MDEPTRTHREPGANRPLVKRRWAIVSRAGGGAALVAVTGAIALSGPADQKETGDEPAGRGVQTSAEA
jgi:hypothetical protein